MSTTTFSEYCATIEARETIQQNIVKWTEMLCEALRENYISYSIRMIHRNHEAFGSDKPMPEYSAKRLAHLRNGEGDMKFVYETGRKYHKIWEVDSRGSRSCHAFIDKKTGQVYKPASYKAPAKGVRYDLRIIEQREWLLENADWAGGYLYIK